MTDPVQAQYEALPYPRRDPAEEKRRLIDGSPSNLKEVDHYVFAGRRDFTRPFRALVAGGGTGDGLMLLAQQLAADGGLHRLRAAELGDVALDEVFRDAAEGVLATPRVVAQLLLLALFRIPACRQIVLRLLFKNVVAVGNGRRMIVAEACSWVGQ